MSLDRHHLQLLAALAEHGRLGAAARSLHLSPSAASHRIREAERRLRVPLIEIEGRVAKLTSAGRLLAETARLTERQLTRAEQASRWLHHGAGVDRLRVGVNNFDLLEWHALLFRAAPVLGVHSVDLVSVPGGTEPAALERGDIDLAIVVTAKTRPTAEGWAHLSDDRLVAVLPPDVPCGDVFHPEDVAGHDFLAFGFEPLEGWELDRFLAPDLARPRSMRQVDRLSALLTLVGRGSGVSIQPERAVADAMTAYDVAIRPLSVELPVRWYLVTGAGDDDGAMTAMIRDLFVDGPE